MLKEFMLRRLARKLGRCKVTKLSRPVLRDAQFVVNGKPLRALDYIDHVAAMLPVIKVNGEPINFKARMREVYYRNGQPGLNIYVKYVKLRVAVEMKKKKS